jgi:LysM repeat protein
LSVHAAPSAKQEQEYEQVRRIALRDPKVRAAYAEADRKLEAKILQIDPSLVSYVHRAPEKANSTASVKPAPKPAPKPAVVPARPTQRAHVVVKGETLGSIAAKYGVSVATLKTTNHISDEKKLAVGQVIAIPKSKESH